MYDGGVKRKRVRRSSGSGKLVAMLVLFSMIMIAIVILLVLKPWEKAKDTTTTTPKQPTSSAKTPTVKSAICTPNWFYWRSDDKYTSHKNCATDADDPKAWCQLNNYTAGGRQGKDWIYTDDEANPDCKKNWSYYDSGGRLIKANIASITKEGDNKFWCATKDYHAGGRQGVDWAYC